MSWLDDTDDLDDDFEDYDESTIRTRPNPKANRPRTKRRPAHEDAEVGRVLGVDRGRYSVLVGEDTPDERMITTTRARELRRMPIVTGDQARVVGDTSGDEGTLARIVGIVEERGGLDYARSRAREYAERAEEALSELARSPAVDALCDAVVYAVGRTR